jgi:hypothetical protein
MKLQEMRWETWQWIKQWWSTVFGGHERSPSGRGFAKSGSEGLLGSGNTVWDHDGEYFDKLVIAEIFGSVTCLAWCVNIFQSSFQQNSGNK